MTYKVLLLVLLSCLSVTLAVALTHGQADSDMVISSLTANPVLEANSDKVKFKKFSKHLKTRTKTKIYSILYLLTISTIVFLIKSN